MYYKVKEVADMAGVSVRTLHHYSNIGLLVPKRDGVKGYMLYDESDIRRLEQILFFKELDVELSDIRGILDSEGFKRRDALVEEKRLLGEKEARIKRIIKLADRTISSIDSGMKIQESECLKEFNNDSFNFEKQEFLDGFKILKGKEKADI